MSSCWQNTYLTALSKNKDEHSVLACAWKLPVWLIFAQRNFHHKEIIFADSNHAHHYFLCCLENLWSFRNSVFSFSFNPFSSRAQPGIRKENQLSLRQGKDEHQIKIRYNGIKVALNILAMQEALREAKGRHNRTHRRNEHKKPKQCQRWQRPSHIVRPKITGSLCGVPPRWLKHW